MYQDAKSSESRAIVLIPCCCKFKTQAQRRKKDWLGKFCKINIYRKAVPSKKPSSGCWFAAGTSSCHTAPGQLASRELTGEETIRDLHHVIFRSAARAQIARPIVGPASSKRLGLNSFEMLSGFSPRISEALLLFCLTFSLSDAQRPFPFLLEESAVHESAFARWNDASE